MIPYTFNQIMFFFFIYCFLGWIIESTWVSAHQKKLINRGFMRGPFIPIYGCGAMTLLLVGTPLLKWPVAVFFAGIIAASILEYFTGAAMEAIFKVRYWDYSEKFLNINGHVCLFNSLCWGFLALAEDYFLHKPIEKLSKMLTYKELNLFVMVLSMYFVFDLTMSFKAAFDLRDIIIKMEKAKEELLLMQKRLDVMLAFANEERKEFFEESFDRAEDIAKSVEARLEAIKKAIEDKPSEFAENVRDEFHELRDKYVISKANHFGRTNFKDYYKRSLIKGNPTMVSKKFKYSFESIREYVNEKKEK